MVLGEKGDNVAIEGSEISEPKSHDLTVSKRIR